MEMSALKGCVIHSPMGCPVSVFDLIINTCERDSLRVHLILAKHGNVPSSGAIIVLLLYRSYGQVMGGASQVLCILYGSQQSWNGISPWECKSCDQVPFQSGTSWNHGLFLLCYIQQNPHPQSEQPATHEDLDSGLLVWTEALLLQKKRKESLQCEE